MFAIVLIHYVVKLSRCFFVVFFLIVSAERRVSYVDEGVGTVLSHLDLHVLFEVGTLVFLNHFGGVTFGALDGWVVLL